MMTTIDPDCRAHADAHTAHRARLHIRPVAAVAANIRPLAAVAALASSALLGGCAVVSIAGTAASVAASAASTVVDVGIGAVKVTGRVIGKGVDLVTGPDAPPTPSRQ